MADKKISQLTALSAANLAPSTDVLAIVDTSATETKKIVAQDLINGVLNVASAVGIGTASPAAKLDVNGSGRFRGFDSGYYNENVIAIGNASYDPKIGMSSNAGYRWNMRIADVGASGAGNFVIRYEEGSLDALVMTRTGNLGLGVTPSAWGSGYKSLDIGSVASFFSDNNLTANVSANQYIDAGGRKYKTTDYATMYQQYIGQHQWYTAPSGTINTAISFTQAMTLDASGNLLVGTTSSTGISGAAFKKGATTACLLEISGNNGTPATDSLAVGQGADNLAYVYQRANAALLFGTNNTARGRFTAAGDFLVNTTNVTPGTSNVVGFAAGESGYISVSRDSAVSAEFNRKTNDGDIIVFRQDGTQEGSISVSGNTISYNAFAGSHWSQLQDGSKPDILRGTVMESINELCVWPGEVNERLPKAKISDTAGSKKVYGVFMAWDNDWTETNDMYVTAVGAFICRVNGSVTVQEGDLLESNGDGTARVQADDIIRSSTIGKVTSTVKTHEYDDGSYCVPTVLYCG